MFQNDWGASIQDVPLKEYRQPFERGELNSRVPVVPSRRVLKGFMLR